MIYILITLLVVFLFMSLGIYFKQIENVMYKIINKIKNKWQQLTKR